MRTAMPSPRGTNNARLFVNSNPRGAYDAALPDDVSASLVTFLQGKLSEADLAEFCKLAGVDAGLGMDEPEPFKGMPQPGGSKFGEDSRHHLSFAQRFPHAATIKVNR